MILCLVVKIYSKDYLTTRINGLNTNNREYPICHGKNTLELQTPVDP